MTSEEAEWGPRAEEGRIHMDGKGRDEEGKRTHTASVRAADLPTSRREPASRPRGSPGHRALAPPPASAHAPGGVCCPRGLAPG